MGAVGIVGLSAAVESAVRSAAGATGVDFGFLLKTARRESGFNPLAQAGTSSAAGLFQFVEQTWLATLKRHGGAHGFARYAGLITEAGGRFGVAGGEEGRRAVMDLRFDPHASAVMAAELASDHASYLRGRTGREPTGGELYAAHFLGPAGSARLIEAARATPEVSAAALFPEAAAANRGVFYAGGLPVSVAQLHRNLSATAGDGAGVVGPAAEPDPGEGAFAAYAGAARTERRREQELLVQFLLQGSGATEPSRGAAGSMFTAELLSLLSDARTAPASPPPPVVAPVVAPVSAAAAR